MQEWFLVFITNISLYPTVIFTGLVMFVTLYWIVFLTRYGRYGYSLYR